MTLGAVPQCRQTSSMPTMPWERRMLFPHRWHTPGTTRRCSPANSRPPPRRTDRCDRHRHHRRSRRCRHCPRHRHTLRSCSSRGSSTQQEPLHLRLRYLPNPDWPRRAARCLPRHRTLPLPPQHRCRRKQRNWQPRKKMYKEELNPQRAHVP